MGTDRRKYNSNMLILPTVCLLMLSNGAFSQDLNLCDQFQDIVQTVPPDTNTAPVFWVAPPDSTSEYTALTTKSNGSIFGLGDTTVIYLFMYTDERTVECSFKVTLTSSCPDGSDTVACASNPCDTASCPENANAVCRPNYCGQCSADFYGAQNVALECTTTVPVDECSSQPCQNGGTCGVVFGSFYCVCLLGYRGITCEVAPFACQSGPCQNGATCLSANAAEYSCTCPPGFTGTNCEQNTSPDACSSSPCQNGGICTNIATGYTCLCQGRYTGPTCETLTTPANCSPNPCQNGGTCTDTANGYICRCQRQFGGQNCEVDAGSCTPNSCINGGTCTEAGTGFVCTCPPQYTGRNCQERMTNCSLNPCQNDGSCIDTSTGYVCMCGMGYTGSNCQIEVADPTDPCSSNPCENGATCGTIFGFYYCICAEEYRGIRCQNGGPSGNRPCLSGPCNNGGTCENTDGGYKCTCAPGYSGANCEQVISNSCFPNPCQNGGLCANNPNNGYICSCLSGYFGINCQRSSCSDGILPVACITDPCEISECPASPDAVCRTNNCGGCTAEFYDQQGNEVDCDETDPCPIDECTEEYLPVCGRNGQTYTNLCYLNMAACTDRTAIFLHDGKCIPVGSCSDGTVPVACITDPCEISECPASPDAVCKTNNCGGCTAEFYDQQGNEVDCDETDPCPVVECTEEYLPVCGRNGQTYTNLCSLNMAACTDRTAIFLHDGKCIPVGTCPGDAPAVACITNPCETSSCPKYPDAMCQPNFCGGCHAEYFDAQGSTLNCTKDSCQTQQIECTEEYRPVCGSNGQTYSNLCYLNRAACSDRTITLRHNGECSDSCQTQQIECTEEYRPVCGSNGQTYSNLCYLNRAACSDRTITLRHNGECSVCRDSNGNPINEGAPVPNDDVCSTCTCVNGEPLCLTPVCIPPPRPDCRPRRIPGQCCATEFDCDDDVSTCADVSCLNGGTCTNTPDGASCTCAPGFTGPLCGDVSSGGNDIDRLQVNCPINQQVSSDLTFEEVTWEEPTATIGGANTDPVTPWHKSHPASRQFVLVDGQPTAVSYSFQDDINDESVECSFVVSAVSPGNEDTTPPTITPGTCPSDIAVDAEMGSNGVDWSPEPSAVDDNMLVMMRQNYKPGSKFTRPITKVRYTFYDVAGNNATCEFDVIIGTPPTTDNCLSAPCQNGGRCLKYVGGYRCECTPAYTGVHCETRLPGIDFCVSAPCRNGGRCQSDGNGYRCECPQGYSGVNCETRLPGIDFCASIPCQNGGRCQSDGNGYRCECPQGYTGVNCETSTGGFNYCLSAPCQNGARCQNLVNSYRCECPQGYTGVNCETRLPVADFCLNAPCQNGGVCQNFASGYLCVCPQGYTGVNCETSSTTQTCATFICFNGGTCTNTINGASCTCAPGFTGPNCGQGSTGSNCRDPSGNPINEGQEYQTDDPCQTCVCRGGQPSCRTFACSAPPPGCILLPLEEGECCRRFDCDSGPDPTQPCEVTQYDMKLDGCPTNMLVPTPMGSFKEVTWREPFQPVPKNAFLSYKSHVDPRIYVSPNKTPRLIRYELANLDGLIASCNFTITGVLPEDVDNIPPVISGCPSDISVSASPGQTSVPVTWSPPTATDENELGVSRRQSHHPGAQFPVSCSTTRVWYTFYDAAGNNATCTFNVNIIGDGLDGCSTNPCLNNGRCMPTGGENYVCQCAAGFTGVNCEQGFTGVNCEQGVPTTDYCLNAPCQNGGVCQNFASGYLCVCPQGYSGVNCETRTGGFNYCLSAPCQNGGVCQNLVNGYRCECPQGYSGVNCETSTGGFNYCLSEPCQNGARCQNLVNGYRCECPQGYSGVNCETTTGGFNYCLSAPCQNGARCQNFASGYTCECPQGYSGVNCETRVQPPVDPNDVCASQPCQNNGRCMSINSQNGNQYFCICETGNWGIHCEHGTAVTTPCSNSPCANGGTCTDIGFGYTCSCPQGYSGNNCEQGIDYCLSAPCQNGGVCQNNANGYECVCPQGYSGVNCETTTGGFNYCLSAPCQNGGVCQNLVNGYRCECPQGYSGVNCETSVQQPPVDPNDVCSSNPCQQNGRCMSINLGTINQHYCICETGTWGINCEFGTAVTTPCSNSPCVNGGTCTDIGAGGYTCTCLPGYSGSTCNLANTGGQDSTPPVITGCPGNIEMPVPSGQNYALAEWEEPTANGGALKPWFKTLADPRIWVSLVTDPFTVEYKYQDAVKNEAVCSFTVTAISSSGSSDPCANSPCGNGVCSNNGFGGYLCSCNLGYFGVNCELGSGPTDPCANNPCVNGACSANGGGYLCSCNPGFSGINCDQGSGPSDPCANNPCVNGACVDIGGGYQCNCNLGFFGANCEQGSGPTDACANNPCVNGACSANGGGYLCSCNPGFFGINCDQGSETSDPCANNPCVNGACSANGFGGYLCSCNPGFSGINCDQGLPASPVTFRCSLEDVSQVIPAGAQGANIHWSDPNIPPMIMLLIQSRRPGDYFPVGSTQVTYTYLNEMTGSRIRCPFNVIVTTEVVTAGTTVSNPCIPNPCIAPEACYYLPGTSQSMCFDPLPGRKRRDADGVCKPDSCDPRSTCHEIDGGVEFVCVCDQHYNGPNCYQAFKDSSKHDSEHDNDEILVEGFGMMAIFTLILLLGIIIFLACGICMVTRRLNHMKHKASDKQPFVYNDEVKVPQV